MGLARVVSLRIHFICTNHFGMKVPEVADGITPLTLEKFSDFKTPNNSSILYFDSLIYFLRRVQGLKFKPCRTRKINPHCNLPEHLETNHFGFGNPPLTVKHSDFDILCSAKSW